MDEPKSASRRTSGPPIPLKDAQRWGDATLAASLRELLWAARECDPESEEPATPPQEPVTPTPGVEATPENPDENPDRWTHRFHAWPAALHPDAAARALELLPEGPLADPFCGGGTSLVEAMARGRTVIGRDLSALAVRVARARCTIAPETTLTAFRSACRKATDEARAHPLPCPPERQRVLGEWYEPHVLSELESLRHACMKSSEDIRPLMVACFSSILVKTSLRESETVARRIQKRRPPGTTAILFHKKARELGRRLESFRLAVPEGTPPADILQADARFFVSKKPIAAVLSSPPYPGVYDYLPMQLLRHVWLGIDQEADAAREMGSRRAFRKDFDSARAFWRKDSGRWLEAMAQAMMPGGRMILLVGDGRAGSKIIGVEEPLRWLGDQTGLRPLASASVLRPEPGWGPGRLEHALLFEKGPSRP